MKEIIWRKGKIYKILTLGLSIVLGMSSVDLTAFAAEANVISGVEEHIITEEMVTVSDNDGEEAMIGKKISETVAKENVAEIEDMEEVLCGDTEVQVEAEKLEESKIEANSKLEDVYEAENYKVLFQINSFWEGAYNATISIENTGTEAIENWCLEFPFTQQISNIWNAEMVQSENGDYIINNLGWNQDIPVGGSVYFGFCILGNIGEFPEKYGLRNTKAEVTKEDYVVTYEIVDDWQTGFQGNIIITNCSKEAIKDWQLSFIFENEISTIWNGEIILHEDDYYTIKNPAYSQNIDVGASTTIGFIVNDGNSANMISDTILEHIGRGIGNEVVQENIIVEVDTSWMDKHENIEMYIINEKIDNLNGTLTENEKVVDLSYIVCDMNENIVDSGFITPNQNWEIPFPGLVIGVNYVTISAKSIRGNVYKKEICFMNSCIDNMEYADVDKEDSDSDGLINYFESIYKTDFTDADSDDDDLTDYEEIILCGTNPLLFDTDGDGIWDGDEDYDKDGLNTREELKRETKIWFDDSDGDGLSDGDEVNIYFTNPLDEDSDNDDLWDGIEINIGTSPTLEDSDYNGVLDSKEIIYQTLTEVIDTTKKSGINQVSVSMECEGYINNGVTIMDTYNLDMRSSEVVGLVGVPVDISTNQHFSSATICFYYDDTVLMGVKEENLGIMWYDEVNDNYILVEEIILDTENNTIACNTNHFSTWLVVDKEQWKKCWDRTVFVQEGASSGGYSSLTLEMEDGIHRYQLFENHGTWQDAEEICTMAGGYLATIQNATENMAVYNYIREQGCVSAYIGFSDAQSEGKWKWSNGEAVKYTNWHEGEPNGSTNENYAMYYYKYEDGSWNDGAFNEGYTVNDVSIFICEWQDIDIETDADGDGLPDYYEKNGFFMSNGTIVYTEPGFRDTDEDGISDFDEVGGLPEWEEYQIDGKLYKGFVNHPSSYGKLSSEFIFVDGTMNTDGTIINSKMSYVPYSNAFIEEKYVADTPTYLFGIQKTAVGAAGVHGLYKEKLLELEDSDFSKYAAFNTLVQVGIAASTVLDRNAIDCFKSYALGYGGDEDAWGEGYSRKSIDVEQWILRNGAGVNSAKECCFNNIIRVQKAVESVVDEKNNEVYLSISPYYKWSGCDYVDYSKIETPWETENIDRIWIVINNLAAFGTFNSADAGITLHCTYYPDKEVYIMEYNYCLIDYYDYSFLDILHEQDGLGIAKGYELYGYWYGICTWKKGDDTIIHASRD